MSFVGKYKRMVLFKIIQNLAIVYFFPGMKHEDLTALYFSQLSDIDVNALYKIYEEDFNMFGYTYRHGERSYPY